MTYITTYPPSGVRVFNATWTALHTLLERIHVLRKRPQYIFRSPLPRCVVVIRHTTDMQPLPYDRDCRSGIHITRWKEIYLFIDASLQKSKLLKINVESKSQLACHLLRLV
jgi:hypothetical protein